MSCDNAGDTHRTRSRMPAMARCASRGSRIITFLLCEVLSYGAIWRIFSDLRSSRKAQLEPCVYASSSSWKATFDAGSCAGAPGSSLLGPHQQTVTVRPDLVEQEVRAQELKF